MTGWKATSFMALKGKLISTPNEGSFAQSRQNGTSLIERTLPLLFATLMNCFLIIRESFTYVCGYPIAYFFISTKQNADYGYMMYVHIKINNDGTIVGK